VLFSILAIDRACTFCVFACFIEIFLFLVKAGLDLDVADEPQWYIPAGIDLSDLQRSLIVIEQFEKTPLDLEGKRAAQLLHKKRRSRRRRTRGEANDDEDDDDDDGRKRKVARKTREKEKYTSAQFIEDSDEEYGRDIEEFFAQEAALRERTALAAVDSLSHIGTMRATGTKKRRRKQTSLDTTTVAGTKGRVAKRSRRTALSSSGMHDVDSEEQSEGGDHGGFKAGALRPSPAAAASDDGDSDGEDDDDGGDDGSRGGDIDHDSDRSSRSFLAHRDVAAVKHRHSDPPLVASPQSRPKARPRYRGVPIASQARDNGIPDDTSPPRTGTDDDDVGQAQQQEGQDRLPSRASTPVLPLPSVDHDKGDFGRQATISSSTSSSNGGGPPKGRTRLIISDEEE
jgi:replication fork protection complex subunit Tof1/Swi1